MIEIATAIELIDIPTEELMVRLKDGKVYLDSSLKLPLKIF